MTATVIIFPVVVSPRHKPVLAGPVAEIVMHPAIPVEHRGRDDGDTKAGVRVCARCQCRIVVKPGVTQCASCRKGLEQ